MKTFFISDQHYGHENILKFKCLNGIDLIRPEFSSVEEMDETMIQNHNKAVSPEDKVYFLGDVAMNGKVFNQVMPKLNGKKTLILGNHDKLRMDEYYKYFDNIYSSRYMGEITPKLVLCHYPLHIDVNHPKSFINVHGHIHEKIIRRLGVPDPRYFNVSVERINYTPIELDEMLCQIEQNKNWYEDRV